MTKTIDALVEILEIDRSSLGDTEAWMQVRGIVTAALAQARAEQAEPVDWRGHVEQRLLTWRQSFVNRSGDQLALDDFMDKESLDDLIDFVCDEYTTPPAAPVAKLEPLTEDEITNATKHIGMNSPLGRWHIARAVEAAHNAKLGNK